MRSRRWWTPVAGPRRPWLGALLALLLLVGAIATRAPLPATAAILDGQTVRLAVTGTAGVPTGAAAVVLNVTATASTGGGFVTVWPCDEPRPLASSLNLVPGLTTPNLVLARPGAGGLVCLFTQTGTDLVVDLAGHVPADGEVVPLASPTRFLDTRSGTGGRSRLAGGQTIRVDVTGRLAVPADAEAVLFNLTGVDAAGPGFVIAWPCDQPRPLASDLNLDTGAVTPNLVLARTAPGGEVCLFSQVATDLVLDVVGFTPPGRAYRALRAPVRVLDTRTGTGAPAGPLTALVPLRLAVAGTPLVPRSASAVVLNVTATEAAAPGFVTVWPCDRARPLASNLNPEPGVTRPNRVVVRPGATGEVCLASLAPTQLVVDLAGWFTADSSYLPVDLSVRLLDTRGCLVTDAGPDTADGPTRCGPVRHAFPVAGTPVSYGRSHAGYPGTDVFAPCGAPVVAPTDGTVLQVRRVDRYDRRADNPALRGGLSVAVLGDDGVRYYGAHFSSIEPLLAVGQRVAAGDPIATVGRTGDTSVCHVHFGLSIPCPGPEWAVRRGLVWPWPYLDAWRAGAVRSPVDELAALARARPTLCADAMAMPTAADAA